MADLGALAVAAGRLLVATPALGDPNFEHTVVLLLDVDEGGALGVVLNRPSPVPVADVLRGWSPYVAAPDVLFAGGPVSTDSALAVARLPDQGDGVPAGFRPIYGDTGILDLDSPAELTGERFAGLRIFAGYAGWDSDQLEREIAEGSWYVLGSQPSDAFGDDPLHLWSRVLRRQPGELAWISTRPLDPTLN